mmetsp:Transcript_20567/g.65639  ORF Transcript_20567/g.65639 Transcript_20567/m.65639 type:complete len:282 (+) Transcript_20567:693-1538(+)
MQVPTPSTWTTIQTPKAADRARTRLLMIHNGKACRRSTANGPKLALTKLVSPSTLLSRASSPARKAISRTPRHAGCAPASGALRGESTRFSCSRTHTFTSFARTSQATTTGAESMATQCTSTAQAGSTSRLSKRLGSSSATCSSTSCTPRSSSGPSSSRLRKREPFPSWTSMGLASGTFAAKSSTSCARPSASRENTTPSARTKSSSSTCRAFLTPSGLSSSPCWTRPLERRLGSFAQGTKKPCSRRSTPTSCPSAMAVPALFLSARVWRTACSTRTSARF